MWCLSIATALISNSLHATASGLVPPASVAAQYSLTTSSALPFPTVMQSTSDAQTFIESQWSLDNNRISWGGSDIAFVDDPFPNNPVPGSATNTTTASSSSSVLQIAYPAGSFSDKTGGAQWYTIWNTSDGSTFDSMLLSYELAFDLDFNWVKGGKLPGLRGGPNTSGCSGGSQSTGDDCFSMRLMWRASGAGEAYAYMLSPNNLCSESNIMVGPLQPARWMRITILVQMNNPPDIANGNLVLYFNDVHVLSQQNLQFRSGTGVDIGGMFFSTFFGGSDSSWATPKAVNTYYRDFQLYGSSAPSNLTGKRASSVPCLRRPSRTMIILALMAFSGALTLTDLNDFITPSQACIKPVETLDVLGDVKEPGAASTEIRIDSTGTYYEVSSTDDVPNAPSRGVERKLQQAQISLNDCLACSGCITSAESVLITLQSHNEVLDFLGTNPAPSSPGHKFPVMSIAPQSLASLGARVSSTSQTPVSLLQMLRRVQAFCVGVLGFKRVYDTTFARHIALLEHAQEFLERKRGEGEGRLPMLASACPGWICYAEKTHAEMLPFIARGKSPQQVMGTLVKTWLGGKWGKRPDQIYHVAVMPCYDKKLEASRQDFYSEMYSTRDVDCVITTGELEHLMQENGWDLSIPVDGEASPQPPSFPESDESEPVLPELVMHPGTSSGSYLHTLMSVMTHALSDPLETSVKTIRSSDHEEYIVRNQRTGEVVFRGAKCYGFRNLQNVVRKVGKEAGVQVGRGAAGRIAGGMRVKSKKEGEEKGYDYVEVMACPGGCVNGGGQLRPITQALHRREDEEGYPRDWEESGVRMGDGESGGATAGPKWGNKEWTREVEKAYWHEMPTPPPSPRRCVTSVPDVVDQLAVKVKIELCLPQEPGDQSSWGSAMDGEGERRRRELFRTQYRAVESDVIGLAVKW
ncbi:hypothetical protein ID866_505 [Astraeus odoratus]|nr:hypothetical protein ID866_505 [Astraeus odoratus]